jgi:DNA-binding response OmpR family regulator
MPRILVIDDQPDLRAMIAIVLRVNQFEIVEAASGEAALKEFENSRFDPRSSISSCREPTGSTSSG